MSILHVNAAIQSCRAGWWEMLMVRLFGTTRIETDDFGNTVTLRKWRGRSYLWDFS